MSRGWNSGKTGQLRVRLTPEERDALERIAASSKDLNTISDVVREGLQWILKPGHKRKPCSLDSETMKLVEDLAGELNRSPEQVLAECVHGIIDQLPDNTVPLIVQEWRLRQDYRERSAKKS